MPGLVFTSKYDAFEQLLEDGNTTYEYDALGRVAKRDGDGDYSYDGATNNLVKAGDSRFARDPDGALLSARNGDPANGGSVELTIADQHGDVVAGLATTPDDSVAVAGSKSYDPFGKVTAQAGANGSLGYQGGYTDPATGQVNMASRWYDPETGGFGSRDTWTLDPSPSGNANRYGYANADPLGNTDPTGHCVPAWTKSRTTKTVKTVSRRGGAWGLIATVAWDVGWEVADHYTGACSGDGPSGGSGGGQSPQYSGDADLAYAAGVANSCYWCVFPTPPLVSYTTPTAPPGPSGPRGPSRPPKNPSGRPPTKPKPPVKPKPPHRPTAPTNRPPTPATAVVDQAAAVAAMIRAGLQVGAILQSVADVVVAGQPYTPPQEHIDQMSADQDVQEFADQLVEDLDRFPQVPGSGSDGDDDRDTVVLLRMRGSITTPTATTVPTPPNRHRPERGGSFARAIRTAAMPTWTRRVCPVRIRPATTSGPAATSSQSDWGHWRRAGESLHVLPPRDEQLVDADCGKPHVAQAEQVRG
ncbi:RHS repeat-associated core domain-containing protein [Streptodolium elevatio]